MASLWWAWPACWRSQLRLRGPPAVFDRGRRALVLGGVAGGGLVIVGGALARLLEVTVVQQSAPEPIEANAAVALSGHAPKAQDPEPLTMPLGVAEEVTSNDRFYIVSKNFNDPRVSADKWSLQVFGWWRSPRGSHMRRPWRYRE